MYRLERIEYMNMLLDWANQRLRMAMEENDDRPTFKAREIEQIYQLANCATT